MDRRILVSSLKVLKLLHEENFKEGSKSARISYEEFYIPEIAEKIDIRSDYLNWISNKLRPFMRGEVSGEVLVRDNANDDVGNRLFPPGALPEVTCRCYIGELSMLC